MFSYVSMSSMSFCVGYILVAGMNHHGGETVVDTNRYSIPTGSRYQPVVDTTGLINAVGIPNIIMSQTALN